MTTTWNPEAAGTPAKNSAPAKSSTPAKTVTYEYLTVTAPCAQEQLYLDSYSAFGWFGEPGTVSPAHHGTVTLHLKRDRRVPNRAEVTELQHRGEAALRTIQQIEQANTAIPTAVALGVGIVGTAFMAVAVFSYLAGLWPLMVVAALFGFAGWAAPLFVSRRLAAKRAADTAAELDRQRDLLYDSCERAAALLA